MTAANARDVISVIDTKEGNECKEGFGGRAVVHDFYELEIK